MTLPSDPGPDPAADSASPAPAPHLIEVAFGGNRKDFFLWDAPEPPPLKAAVIVDADRGEDLGYVHALGELADKRNAGTPHGYGRLGTSKKARRFATRDEVARASTLKADNEDARRRAMERVKANDLVMKVSDAEWQWDRKKLTLYFTAERRVDFRTLVRELASMFRTRIELKQIGVRDEAKRLDGIGRCGRQYCSSSWLPELRPVNLGVAKDQRLSLNPSQISGACGRLMCCLRYEHDFYVHSRKRFPKEGRIVRTKRGEEKIISNDIFRERVTLRGDDGEFRTILLTEYREETAATPTPSEAFASVVPNTVAVPLSDFVEDDDMTSADAVTPADDADLIGDDEAEAIEMVGSDIVFDGEPAPDAGEQDAVLPRPKPDNRTAEEKAERRDTVASASGERRPHRRRGRRGGRRNKPGGPSDPPPGSPDRGDG